MRRTRVKICGLTRPEDVTAAAACGADAVGFVFAPRSSRRLDVEVAVELAARTPALIARVGLFQDQDVEQVAEILDRVPLNLLQFHGEETAGFCRQFGLPYLKAVSMAMDDALATAGAAFPDAAGLVLDSHAPGRPGGTGKAFDWSQIGTSSLPLIVAGGLGPGNVRAVILGYRPWGVDVSSGVERRPGIKDHSLIEAFFEEVDRGDRSNG